MFSGADSFNQPLNDWNVSNDVTSMAVRRNEPRVIELPRQADSGLSGLEFRIDPMDADM